MAADADAESTATPGNGSGGGGDGGGSQTGLVDVNVEDLVVQLPVAVAANVCDVNVNVLALQRREGGAECSAASDAIAG